MTPLIPRIWRAIQSAIGIDPAQRHHQQAPISRARHASAFIAKERLLLTLDRHGPTCRHMTPQATQDLVVDVLAAINKHSKGQNPLYPTVSVEQTPYSLSIRMETP